MGCAGPLTADDWLPRHRLFPLLPGGNNAAAITLRNAEIAMVDCYLPSSHPRRTATCAYAESSTSSSTLRGGDGSVCRAPDWRTRCSSSIKGRWYAMTQTAGCAAVQSLGCTGYYLLPTTLGISPALYYCIADWLIFSFAMTGSVV